MLSIDMPYLLKIAAEGAVVAVAAYAIPNRAIRIKEILAIALTAMVTFAIVDMFAPSMASAARLGSGFAIGSRMIGGGSTQVGLEDDVGDDDNNSGDHHKHQGGARQIRDAGDDTGDDDGSSDDDKDASCQQCSSYKFTEDDQEDGPFPTGKNLLDM
jgi:hypothetical protein